MNVWMGVGLVSLVGNALLLLFWSRRNREDGLVLAKGPVPPPSFEAVATVRDGQTLSEALDASNRQLRQFTQSSLIGYFTWEESQTEGIANQAFCEMLGYPIPEGSGPDYPFTLNASLIQELDRAGRSESGRSVRFESDILRFDGTKAHLIISVQYPSRYPGRASLLAVDFSSLFEARWEFSRSEERCRALTEGSPVGIWNIRSDGTSIYLNSAMVAVLELESALDLTGTTIHFQEFFTPASLETIRTEHSKHARGQGSNYEVEVLGRWGKRTRMVIYSTPMLSKDGALESLMGTFLDITERKREEEALRQSEERLRVAAECGNDLIYEWDLITGRLDWFGAVEQRLGYPYEDIPRTRDEFDNIIHPDDRAGVIASVERHINSRVSFVQEYRVRSQNGSFRIWADRGTAIWDAAGVPEKWIGSASDVTESRRAQEALRVKEEQFRQSQKLEAVGRLAGGIAHDFNNLLAAIMGYCELMLIRLEPNHICRREVGEILNGSDRAAGLIRQLLAFSRQEIPQPKVIQPSFVINSMERMLRHVLEENINLRLEIGDEAGMVRIDPVQLEQVIMNLILNARDAMPNGGTLALSSASVELQGDLPGAFGRIQPGHYVKVSVADSGLGIDSRHLPHIFDPFYTTKVRGKGNGLGLSTVYGIITQNEGCVVVETELTKGTVFSFFLPLTHEEPERKNEVQKAMRASTLMPKTLLVVEDDDEVRRIIADLLGGQGFMVLEAKHGKEALALVEEYSLPIHLLLTDVVMPEMGGKELADELRRHMSGLRVLFMSGNTQDSAFREEVALGDRAFIQKPFAMSALVGKIREVLA